ncbi:MAG: excinuclease ABC subunit UvrC [Bacteroidia bacterium]
MQKPRIKSVLSSLPDSPGVYKYYDIDGELLYIGKAKSLKKRVSSYFLKSQHENRKTALMVSKVEDIQFVLVDTEIDALLLENSLIKKFQPRYNINLKDDKTYPYLQIVYERFPRIITSRKPEKDGSEFFGPYASGLMMRTIRELITTLYPLRTCTYDLSEKNIEAQKYKPCLEYQIGNCKAPCAGYQTEEDYNKMIREIRHILRGNISVVVKHLTLLMRKAAQELRFEEAEQFRKKLELLESYQSKSTVVSHTIHNVDVFSLVSDDKLAFVNYLKVANGIIIQTQTFEMKKKLDESDEELLELAIGEVRDAYKSTATEIVVPFELTLQPGKIVFTVPKAGDKKKLLDLSLKNALYYKRDKMAQYEKLDPGLKTDRILSQMQMDLKLKAWPRHIECFDNSNIQGAFPVSAMVVFKDAKPSKKDYRHFNVKTVTGPNDFDTMKEVVTRRYARVLEEQQPLPDLVIIDGGKGQLSSVVAALKELGIYGKFPVLGIAKRLEELYFPGDELPLYLDKKSETLRIIQQLRDEAHRFGITHHRQRRQKGTLVSELDQIKGIGSESVNMLLAELKSVKQIRMASQEMLRQIIGKHKGDLVWHYFHPFREA